MSELMNSLEYLKQQCEWLHEEEQRVESIRLNILRSLRMVSGCGLESCRRALIATNYEAEAALEYLRTEGW